MLTGPRPGQGPSVLLLALVLLQAPAAAAGEPQWEEVAREGNFIAMMRETPGRNFPTFRGTGVIDANLFELLAILSDVRRHPEWMSHNAEARMLRKVSEFEYYVYSRTDAPWPVSDRDAVYHSTVEVLPRRKTVIVHFRAVEGLVPPVDGVVRMHKLRGLYKLRSLGPKRTAMDFQIDADPEGLIPKWVAKIATRKAPLVTMRNLYRQLVKTRGWYNERIRRWRAMQRTLDR